MTPLAELRARIPGLSVTPVTMAWLRDLLTYLDAAPVGDGINHALSLRHLAASLRDTEKALGECREALGNAEAAALIAEARAVKAESQPHWSADSYAKLVTLEAALAAMTERATSAKGELEVMREAAIEAEKRAIMWEQSLEAPDQKHFERLGNVRPALPWKVAFEGPRDATFAFRADAETYVKRQDRGRFTITGPKKRGTK